jgi:HD-like signal output (HDOD) protein
MYIKNLGVGVGVGGGGAASAAVATGPIDVLGSSPCPGVRRILFVDDDQNVLDGLACLLRVQRRKWDMTFACGGVRGLEQIQRSAFDVVVSDMRMSCIDGATLLTKVKALQPKAVRIVLSGQTDSEAALRTVFVAHQFLSKPCDAQVMRETIMRACALNDLVGDEGLRAMAGEVSSLPPAPGIYLALTKVLAKDCSSICEAAAVVARDVGLTAKILQVVNSAFFGLSRKVASVAEAAALLGTSTLKSLVLAMESFTVPPGGRGCELVALQRHSLLIASLARQILIADKRKADAAFVAGMLHDVGHLIGARAAAPVAPPRSEHAHLGAYLLGLWGLPFTVIEAVAHHEAPWNVEHQEFDVLDAVYVADAIITGLAPAGIGNVDPPAPIDLAYLGSRGVTGERLTAWEASARQMLSAPTGLC